MTAEPLELAVTADERTLLTCFLDGQREALVRKCAGLPDDQLRRHAVPSSNLTLLGLVRHMAGVERWYFQAVMAEMWPGGLYTATDDGEEDFNDLDSATGEAAFGVWRAEVDQSRRVTAEHPLDAICTMPSFTGPPLTPGSQYTVRWVLTHMIEEYARHNGHADLIREAIDGETGE